MTNDLTTMVSEKGTEVIPALGETFAHRVQFRLLLGKIPNCPNGGYTALLKKSTEHRRCAAKFTVRCNCKNINTVVRLLDIVYVRAQ